MPTITNCPKCGKQLGDGVTRCWASGCDYVLPGGVTTDSPKSSLSADLSPDDIAKQISADEYCKEYSEETFWDKLVRFTKAAGSEVIERALHLYFAAQHPDVPAWAKAVIYSALGYFIFPIDAIPDVVPVVGYGDDLGVLAAAIATVATYITPAVKQQARDKMKDYFG